MSRAIATIGVYGTTRESFFKSLAEFRTTHFVDIRNRRGMRGSKYSYANSTELQRNLERMEIDYIHLIDLAPSNEMRDIQRRADAARKQTKGEREHLSPEFEESYRTACLSSFDLSKFLEGMPQDARIVFFCVERNPKACHRYLVADALSRQTGVQWSDITQS